MNALLIRLFSHKVTIYAIPPHHLTHTHTHTRAHAHAHAHTHTHTHTHTRTHTNAHTQPEQPGTRSPLWVSYCARGQDPTHNLRTEPTKTGALTDNASLHLLAHCASQLCQGHVQLGFIHPLSKQPPRNYTTSVYQGPQIMEIINVAAIVWARRLGRRETWEDKEGGVYLPGVACWTRQSWSASRQRIEGGRRKTQETTKMQGSTTIQFVRQQSLWSWAPRHPVGLYKGCKLNSVQDLCNDFGNRCLHTRRTMTCDAFVATAR